MLVVGAGKAAARMAQGAEDALEGRRLRGVVIVADGCAVPVPALAVRSAGHPVPDRRGLDATRALLRHVAAPSGDPLLCLIGGGASSLLVQPAPPVTLADKLAVNQLLLTSGADIHEINTVRKHLSLVKGGGLLRAAGARSVVTLMLSDVVGDDPSVIGSGPTVPDPTTFADAMRVLARYQLTARLPRRPRERLLQGAAGLLAETLKAVDTNKTRSQAVVVGSNRLALTAAAAAAARLGYEPWLDPVPLTGETSAAAASWWARAAPQLRGHRACAIAGGETTVAVRGPGRGGRNQEFALALVDRLAGFPGALLSAGSDGIDGPTDAAGAFVDGGSLDRARVRGLDPAKALAANDSYTFFQRLGDLFCCGPTGTNVMDLKLAVSRSFGS